MDDRLLDLAADAAHGSDRVSLAALGPQQDRLLADVARTFDAGEGMDFGAFVDVDRSVLGVEHDHGMDHGAGGDVDVARAPRTARAARPALDPAAAGGRKSSVNCPGWPASGPRCSSTWQRARPPPAGSSWPPPAARRSSRGRQPGASRPGDPRHEHLAVGVQDDLAGPVGRDRQSRGLNVAVDQQQVVARRLAASFTGQAVCAR